MIKRNHTYSVGDTEYSMEGYKLVCKTAGTTAPTPINMGGGQTITDGTVEWESLYGEDAMMSEIYEELPRTVVDGYIPYKVIANGYVVLNTDPNVSSTKIIDIRTSVKQIITANTGTYYQTVFMPVFAGQQIYFDASQYSWVNSCRFYYTVGEAKRLGLL